METTLAVIKPDAMRKKLAGEILRRIEAQDLSVAAMKMVRLTKRQAEEFYQVHHDKGFFKRLVAFMSEGPIVVMVLRGEQAIGRWREMMGVTDPAQASDGTIRKLFGENIEANAVHGSDSAETARFEIDYFFDASELVR